MQFPRPNKLLIEPNLVFAGLDFGSGECSSKAGWNAPLERLAGVAVRTSENDAAQGNPLSVNRFATQ